jgi:hypothetical protein
MPVPALWVEANLSERRKMLLTMLEAVYVDPVKERSDNESVPAIGRDCGETARCSWWRRGKLDLRRNTYLTVLIAASWAAGSTSQYADPTAGEAVPLIRRLWR